MGLWLEHKEKSIDKIDASCSDTDWLLLSASHLTLFTLLLTLQLSCMPSASMCIWKVQSKNKTILSDHFFFGACLLAWTTLKGY